MYTCSLPSARRKRNAAAHSKTLRHGLAPAQHVPPEALLPSIASAGTLLQHDAIGLPLDSAPYKQVSLPSAELEERDSEESPS